MRAIPGHDQYVLYPYGSGLSRERGALPEDGQAMRCQASKCSSKRRVRRRPSGDFSRHTWAAFRDRRKAGGGQHSGQVLSNSSGDLIGIYVGNDRLLWLYIRAGDIPHSAERAARMQRYSRMIREQMGDQELGGNPERYSVDGWSVSVQRGWTRDDETEWPEAAQWIKEQHARLQAILAGSLDS